MSLSEKDKGWFLKAVCYVSIFRIPRPTPPKINGWNSKDHPIEKENHLNQTTTFLVQRLVFGGVNGL